MLSQEQLTSALKSGQGQADTCDHFCMVGAIIDDDRYAIYHNHIGATKTDSQTVHAAPVLGMTAEKLAERIGIWITGLYRGEHISLNAA